MEIRFGKKVLEVRPYIKWNKGHAVSWLLKKYALTIDPSIVPIYIGDDETDEDAFAMLKDVGVTVVVGHQPSQARYYVEDPRSVTWILKEILRLLETTEQKAPKSLFVQKEST